MANNTLFENQLNALNENEIIDFVRTQLLQDLKGVSSNAFKDVLNRAWEQKIVNTNEQEFISEKPRPEKDLELVKCVILRGKEAIVKFLLAYVEVHGETKIKNYFGNMTHQTTSGPQQGSEKTQISAAELITNNFDYLSSKLGNITRVSTKLVQDKIITMDEKDEYLTERVPLKQSEGLFSILIKKDLDQDGLQKLYDILESTSNGHLVRQLKS